MPRVQLPQDSALDIACVTIDGTTDGGALDCVRSNLPSLVPHDDIDHTAGNLFDCTSAANAMSNPVTIVGHGATGRLSAGDGASFIHNKKVIAYQDSSETDDWGSAFDRINASSGRTGTISIVSCYTGAGKHGATLLHKMAKRTGRIVRARTGLVSCKGNVISFETGSTWQWARPEEPDDAPTPINPPTRAHLSMRQRFTIGTKTFDLNNVSGMEVLREIDPGEHSWKPIPKSSVPELLSRIDFGTAPDLGTILAAETARIKINVAGLATPVELVVYGDRLVRATEGPRTFHFTTDDFGDVIDALVR